MCPRPASTKTYDFSMVGCDKLAAAYTEALDAAKVCACDADCGDELPDTFCMNCSVFVSRANDGYRAAKALLDEWQKRLMSGKCVPPPCPAFICPDPVFGGCHGSGPGTTSTCRVMK
jgi:hypothetical protein